MRRIYRQRGFGNSSSGKRSFGAGKQRGELATEQMAGAWRVGCRGADFLGGFPASPLL
jgi:hypothetical protein